MFEPSSDSDVDKIDASDVQAYLDEGRLFRALQAREQRDYEEAIRLLEQINTSEAAFQTALVRVLMISTMYDLS